MSEFFYFLMIYRIIGIFGAWRAGKVILLSAILTSVVVVSLTLYTFWAAWRGHDFEFLGPFLFGALTVIVVFSFIQVICRFHHLQYHPRNHILFIVLLDDHYHGHHALLLSNDPLQLHHQCHCHCPPLSTISFFSSFSSQSSFKS